MQGNKNLEELKVLEESVEKIAEQAKKFGLDFFDMRFEVCPADIIYTFGSYGMPTRFSHWSFGKAFHRMKTQYDYNLGRIYELVINSDPCYAFLLEGNSIIQNKLVIAHVFAHCDFFKNNYHFKKTNRNMVESMAVSANRIREYEHKYGREKVEKFIDAVLALQEHVDFRPKKKAATKTKEDNQCKMTVGESPYEDLWNISEKSCSQTCSKECKNQDKKKFPERPEKDMLMFIAKYSKNLEDWQRDIISIIREEMIYFWPQMETKIMNEGWASFWHLRIMRELDLSEEETIEFAKMHAGILQPSRMSINPYYLGIKIWEDIEKRWDNPTEEEKKKYNRKEGQGRAKIFEVRGNENDISFIRNYLTKELVEELDLYIFKKVYTRWQVTETEWEQVRDTLVYLMTNSGYPVLKIEDADYNLNGELYIMHCHDGRDLDLYYLEKTIPSVYKLWGRTIHLETKLDNKRYLFIHDGVKTTKRLL